MWPFERKPHLSEQYVLERGTSGLSRLPVSLSGVRWDQAPVPPWMHRCWPQTKYLSRTRMTFRCACGAWSIDSRVWANRNLRRRLRWKRRLTQ